MCMLEKKTPKSKNATLSSLRPPRVCHTNRAGNKAGYPVDMTVLYTQKQSHRLLPGMVAPTTVLSPLLLNKLKARSRRFGPLFGFSGFWNNQEAFR